MCDIECEKKRSFMRIDDFKQKRIDFEKSRPSDFDSVFQLYHEYNKIVQDEMVKLFAFSEDDIEEWLNKILDYKGDSDYLTLQILPWKAYKKIGQCDIEIGKYVADSVSKTLKDINNQFYNYSAEGNFVMFHQEVEEKQLDRLQHFFIPHLGRFIPRIDCESIKKKMAGYWLDDVIMALERFGLKVILKNDNSNEDETVAYSLYFSILSGNRYCDMATIVVSPEITVKNPMKE